MPQLDLTELEAKVAWIILDKFPGHWLPLGLEDAERSLYEKVYRAYRDMKAA